MSGEDLVSSLNALKDQQQELIETLSALPSLRDVEEIQADILRHEVFINGNGTEGAKTRISKVETAVKDLGVQIQKLPDEVVNKIVVKIAAIVGIPVLLAVVTLLYEASLHLREAVK